MLRNSLRHVRPTAEFLAISLFQVLMQRTPDVATILLFAVFLIAPIASLTVLGYDRAAERVVDADGLRWKRLVAPDEAYRNDVSRRILTGSPAGMAAIRMRSTLDYKVIGFVNTNMVVSGIDDWLFYKPSFGKGECVPDARIERVLNQVEAMRAVAAGAGIDFRVSISPDKEVVYPDRLGDRARLLAECKIENSKRWRNMASQFNSSVIDHLQALDRKLGDDLIYYRTDTHWNELGRTMALRQLSWLYLQREAGPPDKEVVKKSKSTDLLRMLRLDSQEEYKTYPRYWEEAFKRSIGQGVTGPAVVVHDSFYASMRTQLEQLFPDAKFFGFQNEGIVAALMSRPQHFIANTVEREFELRMTGADLSWNGPIGTGLLAANEMAARDCSMSKVTLLSLKVTSMVFTSQGDFKTGNDPQMLVTLPADGVPCIEVSFATDTAEPTQIFLPILNEDRLKNGLHRAGLSITLTNVSDGHRRNMRIVLPRVYAGRTVRVDPIPGKSEITEMSVSVGTLRQD
jgi:hypothetical protein